MGTSLKSEEIRSPAVILSSRDFTRYRAKRIRITAAERRESVAPGASPGLYVVKRLSTGGAKDFKDSFAPPGLEIQNDTYPGLAPGATL